MVSQFHTPLIHARTQGATPFRMPLGTLSAPHAVMLGPTGGGKSTCLNLLAAQFLRYPNARVYIFDEGASSRVITYAAGGSFYDLASDKSVCFQPLGAIDQEHERTWSFDWLCHLFERERITLTPLHKREIWSALVNLASLLPAHRTLSVLQGLLQDADLRMALAPYTLDGPYGYLLDADHDCLGDSLWQTFELAALQRERKALLPVVEYIFHRLDQRFGQADPVDPSTSVSPDPTEIPPTLVIIDEAWRLLDDPVLEGKIRELLKTARKKRVIVLMATQSLADIADSSFTATVAESCPTRFFLPNSAAMEEHNRALYEAFGLNTRQIAIIQSAMPKRDYYYVSPLGSRLFQLDMGRVTLALCGTGTALDQQWIKHLYDTHGPKGFTEAYLHELGVGDDLRQAQNPRKPDPQPMEY